MCYFCCMEGPDTEGHVPEPIFERAIARGDDWGERKESLLAGLDTKVQAVKGLLAFGEEFSDDISAEEANLMLDKKIAEVRTMLPPEVHARYEQLKALDDELLALIKEENQKNDSGEDFSDELEDEYSRKRQHIESLRASIADNPDVRFLGQIESASELLKKKSVLLEEKRRDGSLLASALAMHDSKLIQDDISEIINTPYDAAFVVKKDSYDRSLRPKSSGYFIRGTPYIFVKENDMDTNFQFTLEHERTHNMLEGVTEIENSDPSKEVRKDRQRNAQFTRLKSGHLMEESLMSKYDGTLFAHQMLDKCHDEFVAAFDFARAHDFKYRPHDEDEDERLVAQVFGKDEEALFREASLATRTVGHHFNLLLAELAELKKEVVSPELKNTIDNQILSLKQCYLDTVGIVEQTQYVSESLGDDVENDLEMLIMLLKPSQYRHLDSYLEAKYSKERIDSIKSYLPLFTEGETSSDVLTQLTSALRDGNLALTPKIEERIGTRIENSEFHFISDEVDSFEKYVHMHELISQLHAATINFPSLSGICESMLAELDGVHLLHLSQIDLLGTCRDLSQLPKDFFTLNDPSLRDLFSYVAAPEHLSDYSDEERSEIKELLAKITQ